MMAELDGVIMKQKMRRTGLDSLCEVILVDQGILEEHPKIDDALSSIDSAVVIAFSNNSLFVEEECHAGENEREDGRNQEN
jgi:hypothetical protein